MRIHAACIAALCVLTMAACAAERAAPAPPAFRLALPADWKPVDQPELESALEQAPPLKIENLGTPVEALDYIETNLVPNAHGWDLLVWYRRGYKRQTRVYMVDLSTGQIKKQTFSKEEGRVRIEMGFTWWGVLGDDGKLYGFNLAGPGWDGAKGSTLLIYRYDPAAREVKVVHKISGHAGERTPGAWSPNGWMYGAASYEGPDKQHQGKASAWGWNPATGQYKDFGPIGKNTGMGYGYHVAACDTHVYVACGANPWYLTAVDVETGRWKILAEAPDGAYVDRLYVNAGRSSMPGYFGGAMAYVQPTDVASRKYYWLWHGQMIPKKTQSFEMDDSCPWPKRLSPMEALGGPEPEVFRGQLYPDENGRATVWWRPQEGKGDWRAIHIDGVEKHPMGVHRLVALSDGRLFGVSAGYQGRFIYDPKTGKATQVGAQGGGSIYAMLEHQGKVYWSGYPSAPIYVYDPAKPWTMRLPGPPGAPQPPPEHDPQSNPRLIIDDDDFYYTFHKTRVKKILSAAMGGDGRIYFGGKGQRDYEGGGLAWINPETNEVGGLWEPWPNREIGWVTPALKGRYLVLATEQGEVFLYDTATHELTGRFTVVEKARKAGPMLEVADGLMLGITHDPATRDRTGIMYGVRVPEGEVLFRRPLPATIPFNWNQGTDHWDYRLGPDGFIWTVLGNVLVRIDPRDTSVHIVGKAESIGQFVFVGRDLYLSGANQLRVVRDVVPRP